MLGQITLPNLPADQLWMVVLAFAVTAFVASMVRTILFRRGAGASTATVAVGAVARNGGIPTTASAQRLDENAQLERLFAIVARSVPSVDRMLQAQAAASRHLDSAEYQLERLFEEFPMLMAARAKSPVRSPSRLRIAPASAAALAA